MTIHGHIICYLTRLHCHMAPATPIKINDHLTSMLAPPLPTLAVLLCYRVSINCFKAQFIFIQSSVVFHFQIANRDIISSIEREMSGDLKQAFKTIGGGACDGYAHIRHSIYSPVCGQQPRLLC